MKEFIAELRTKGYTTKQAEKAYARLENYGYKSLGKWHAQRVEYLNSVQFYKAAAARNMPRVLAERAYNQAAAKGKTPGKWHGQRMSKEWLQLTVGKKKTRVIKTWNEYLDLLQRLYAYPGVLVVFEDWVSSVNY